VPVVPAADEREADHRHHNRDGAGLFRRGIAGATQRLLRLREPVLDVDAVVIGLGRRVEECEVVEERLTIDARGTQRALEVELIVRCLGPRMTVRDLRPSHIADGREQRCRAKRRRSREGGGDARGHRADLLRMPGTQRRRDERLQNTIAVVAPLQQPFPCERSHAAGSELGPEEGVQIGLGSRGQRGANEGDRAFRRVRPTDHLAIDVLMKARGSRSCRVIEDSGERTVLRASTQEEDGRGPPAGQPRDGVRVPSRAGGLEQHADLRDVETQVVGADGDRFMRQRERGGGERDGTPRRHDDASRPLRDREESLEESVPVAIVEQRFGVIEDDRARS
jgi:hypothetical protein